MWLKLHNHLGDLFWNDFSEVFLEYGRSNLGNVGGGGMTHLDIHKNLFILLLNVKYLEHSSKIKDSDVIFKTLNKTKMLQIFQQRLCGTSMFMNKSLVLCKWSIFTTRYLFWRKKCEILYHFSESELNEIGYHFVIRVWK